MKVTGAAMAVVGLHAVHFAYPRPGREPLSVLRGVELTVQPGEMVALLGANGCGKTTLLRLVSGMLKPQAGEVDVAGIKVE